MELRRGCLLLADIGGYGKYLAAVELEHSHDILADLLTTVVSELTGPFELAKLEGDAVFCYMLESQKPDNSDLVSLLEGCYFAFQRRLRNISRLSTCDCNACSSVPRLNLKFVVHDAEFVIHSVVGRVELLGPDVIVAHRLLKNQVKEKTGLQGYALYTSSCIHTLGIDWRARQMRPHVETYDDIGTVEAFLQDLEARWQDEVRERTFYVRPGEAGFEVSADLPASPQVLWDIVTSAQKRPLWQPDVLRIERLDSNDEVGVGTVNHCVHGGYSVKEEIVDWKPYRYFSLRWIAPLGPLVGTIEFSPLETGGTRVSIRMDPEAREPEREALAANTVALKKAYEKGLKTLGELALEASQE